MSESSNSSSLTSLKEERDEAIRERDRNWQEYLDERKARMEANSREDALMIRLEAAEQALSALKGEVVKVLEPFAKVNQPINGEAGRPTPLSLITKETEELAVTAIFDTGGRGAVLWAGNFRALSSLYDKLK